MPSTLLLPAHTEPMQARPSQIIPLWPAGPVASPHSKHSRYHAEKRDRERISMHPPRTIVITGASDGIGAAAARRLHREGHRVVVVGRSPRKTQAIAKELGVDHQVTDFARLDDVRELAHELLSAYPDIDVLANNASAEFDDRTKTVDGFEQTFQVNHLAPFLLTKLLLKTLVANEATVLQTAGVATRLRSFIPTRECRAAKLKNILFTGELHRRYHSAGISTAALHPGNIARSFGIQPEARLMKFVTHNIARSMLTTAERGADQLVWLATARPGIDWQSGMYYKKRLPAKRGNPQALDPDLARRLWERSEELLASTRRT
jgi:NAD(P)-dependent dehydrogenase (short-subunit alcohol dehydrogenase family)